MSTALSILVFLAMSVAPALLFILFLWKRWLGVVLVFLLIVFILGAAAMVYLVYAGGFFGGGVLCLTIPMAASSLSILVGARDRLFRSFAEDRARRRLYWVGLVLVPLLVAGPLLDQFLLVGTCDAWNRRTGDTIVRALEAYKREHQTYPPHLESLVPAYVPAIPSPRCFTPYRWFDKSDSAEWFREAYSVSWVGAEFGLYECSEEKVTLLIIPSVLYDFILRYDLTAGKWSKTNLLDGMCSYLR